LNQGKKSFAHRSAQFQTHNRRVLHSASSTICGAAGRSAEVAFAVLARGIQRCGMATNDDATVLPS